MTEVTENKIQNRHQEVFVHQEELTVCSLVHVVLSAAEGGLVKSQRDIIRTNSGKNEKSIVIG